MSEHQSCATCARLADQRDGSRWCNAVGRRTYDWDMEYYPPCGKARWMPKRDQNVNEDGDDE